MLDQSLWFCISRLLPISSVGRLVLCCKYFRFLSPICEESRWLYRLPTIPLLRFKIISYLRNNSYRANSDIVDNCLEIWNRIAGRNVTIEQRQDGFHVFLGETAEGRQQVQDDLLTKELWIVCYLVPPDGKTVKDLIYTLHDVATNSVALEKFNSIWSFSVLK